MNDYFDRFIRNQEHFDNTISYILRNPIYAGLAAQAADWPYSGIDTGNAGVSPASSTNHTTMLATDAGETPAIPGKSQLVANAGETPAIQGKSQLVANAGGTPALPVRHASLTKHPTPAIFAPDGTATEARNINPYLIDAPTTFIESRPKPLCDVPEILTGSQRLDNDLYMFTEEERNDFIRKEPKSEHLFRRWLGSDEFINNKVRYCIYLGACTPKELREMPRVLKLVEQVRAWRLQSSRPQTVKAADAPNKFYLEVIPTTNFIIVPVVSSERRQYVPIGFMTPDVLCSNQVNIIPSATLFHFAVLTSSAHMAWMRAVCGRLEMRYRYSASVVYNNFPWPGGAAAGLEAAAQAILDARAAHPDSSLADLYDPATMPTALRRAHRANDRAVLRAYGWADNPGEQEIVARLFALYENMVG